MMRCPKDHESSEPDYCSVCGLAMTAQASAGARASHAPAAAALRAPAAAAGGCPSCGEPRTDPAARFCEVCRFDFVAMKLGPAPRGLAATSPAPAVAVAKAPPPMPSVSVIMPAAWELVIAVDPALDSDPDSGFACPKDTPERVIPIDRDLLIGRQDDRRDIHPDIEIIDPGASRRHAKIARLPDGSVGLQDLASTNGTKLNGVDVVAGSSHALREGDAIVIGRWTHIVVRGRS